MGQYWYLFNLDTRRRYGGGKLGEWFWDSQSDVYEALVYKSKSTEFVTEWLKEGDIVVQRGPLGLLAAELLQMIFAELDSFFDQVAFAITCKHVLGILRPGLEKAFKTFHMPPWWGCRLICLGDYASDESLPQGLVTPQEKDAQSKLIIDGGTLEFYGYLLEVSPWTNSPCWERYYALDDHFKRKMHLDVGLWRRRKPLEHPSMSVLRRDIRMIRQLFVDPDPTTDAAPSPPQPEDEDGDSTVQAVCNLSKVEYIREDLLTALVKSKGKLSLAHGLLVQICWSDDPSFALCCEEPFESQLQKGPWAGDSFGIVTLDYLPGLKPLGEREWVDVTERVDALLCHLWKANYGEDDDNEHAEDGEDNDGEHDGSDHSNNDHQDDDAKSGEVEETAKAED